MKEFIENLANSLLLATLIAIPVCILWNYLMPAIFGLPQVSYWGALGLLVLSELLFGSKQSK